MASIYSTQLRLEKPGQGDYLNNWQVPFNRVIDLIDDAVSGVTTVTTTGGTTTLSVNSGTTDEARRSVIYVTGALTSAATIVVPNLAKPYVVVNLTTGSFNVTVIPTGGP